MIGFNKVQTSAAFMPGIWIFLCRDWWPETKCIELLGFLKHLAKNSTSASLAIPSTGGACNLIFSVPCSTPITWLREDLGITFTEMRHPSSDSTTAEVFKKNQPLKE